MNTKEIKKLREATGVGVMDCRQAFVEANGDFDKALEIIRKKGLVKAEGKINRQTSAGLIISYIHNEKIGVLLEIHCETDFVAKLDSFKELAKQIAMQIVAMNPQNTEELMKQLYIKDESIIIGDLIKGLIVKTGENIQVYRFCRYAL
ncbi:MAG: translation elongation factor Ts [Candidatus Liptonbacteria bacterium]|nr:translation elongation factor Ts [Candidatus Liptonbacteria bacterium]